MRSIHKKTRELGQAARRQEAGREGEPHHTMYGPVPTTRAVLVCVCMREVVNLRDTNRRNDVGGGGCMGWCGMCRRGKGGMCSVGMT